MATTNSLNNTLAGQTGTGTFVGSIDPTVTSIAFNPTTQGIVGTTVADDAASGYVGEVISSVVQITPGIPLTSSVITNITSINLTAGDWDVYGCFFVFNNSVVAMVALSSISLTSAALSTQPYLATTQTANPTLSNISMGCVPSPQRINVSTTTTVYLTGFATFATGTTVGCGNIYARRAR